MSNLTAQLTGAITVTPVPGGGSSQQTSGGCSFGLMLREATRSAALVVSQSRARVASDTPVALPFPTNLRARGFYLRLLTGSDAQLTVTFATLGARIIGTTGITLLEVGEVEQISAVSVQGNVDFEWAAWGVATN